jgi:hypothetical protein
MTSWNKMVRWLCRGGKRLCGPTLYFAVRRRSTPCTGRWATWRTYSSRWPKFSKLSLFLEFQRSRRIVLISWRRGVIPTRRQSPIVVFLLL